MPKYVKVQGTWKPVDESADCGKVKINGVWRSVSNSYVKVNNIWRSVCAPVVTTVPTTVTTTIPVTTATTTTTDGGGGVTTTTTAVPAPVINSMTESSTCTTITIAWTGSNYQSYAVTNSLGWTATVNGNGAGGSVTLDVGACGTTRTATLRLYSGLNQTGSTVSQAFTISTTSCAQCVTTTTTATVAAFGITSTSSTSSSVTYSWSNPPAGTAFYSVRYGTNGASTVNGTSHTFSGLSASTAYTVYVEAKNSSNSTLSSASTTITTTAAATTTTAATSETTATTATAAVWYCSGLNVTFGQFQFTDNYDATATECDFYKRVCTTGSYPPYPTSVPACAVTTSSAVTSETATTSSTGGSTTSSTTSTTAGCANPLYGSRCTAADMAFDILGFCTSAGGEGACSFGSGSQCLLGCLD